MRCDQLMRQTVSACFEGERIALCADVVRETNVPFLIVLDERGDLVGAVSRQELEWADRRTSRQIAVGTIATTPPYLCGPEDDVAAVAQAMSTSRTWLALVAEDDRLVGALTIGDVHEELDRSKT